MLLDSKQKYLDNKFTEIASSFENVNSEYSLIKTLKHKIFGNNIKQNINSAGIYLYGGVGRGKTMLMQRFYDQVSVNKKMAHYQQFMQDTHTKIHQLKKKDANKVIELLADNIKTQCSVLCIDEFEINDITDAMIIMRLFSCLKERGVFIFVTTNIKPADLYKDGLQRSAFLPFIKYIEQKFEILHLDIETDYRFHIAKNFNKRIFFSKNVKNHNRFAEIKAELCDYNKMQPTTIEVFGRELSFNTAYNNILFTDFNELYERSLSYADYVAITKKFEIIVVSSVRKIQEAENDIATRFINFIDNVYFNRVLLFMEVECESDELYLAGKKKAEFKRTISRLNEINSYGD